MRTKRYTDIFKLKVIRQVTEGGMEFTTSPTDLVSAARAYTPGLRLTGHSPEETQPTGSEQDEVRRLKDELKWVTQERAILKEAARSFAQESKLSTSLCNSSTQISSDSAVPFA